MIDMDRQLDQSAGAGVYATRIARTLNNGFIALMISVGHRTGLFDVMAALPPSTSAQIANAAGLAERYVREWLAAMTTAHILDYDERTSTYFLRVEYAAVLARIAGANNLAPVAQLLSLLATAEDAVVAGFHSGGGVLPVAYERVNELMSEERKLTYDESYVDALLALVPGMRMHLDLGARVLDAGRDAALLDVMRRMFPRSTFCSGAEALNEPRAYDLVLAFDVMHQQSFPRVMLRKLCASLRRDGVLILQEIAASSQLARNMELSFAPMLYAISCMQSVPVALSDDGEALGKMWGREQAMKLLAEAGFRKVRFETLPSDGLHHYAIAM